VTSFSGGNATFASGGSILACYLSIHCFSGSFTGAQFLNDGGTTYSFSAPFLLGDIDPYILNALGIVGSLSATLNDPSGKKGHGTKGKMGTIGGTFNQTTVTKPASMLLLGTGLLGAGRYFRRKTNI
jgi:hypothetical protein